MSDQEPGNGGSRFVSISNREIYDRIGRVEDLATAALSTLEKVNDTVKDHDKRIRGLELKMYGILAGLVGTLGYVIVSLASKGHL